MNNAPADRPPFFSVVICTFNRAHIIDRALASLKGQVCEDWECIIVDDESTDDTPAVAERFVSDKIKYVRHAHRGCAMSKNAGMEAARGHYITFLDSDDEYRPDHLAKRKSVLEQNPDIDLLHSTVQVLGNPFVPDKMRPGHMIAVEDCVVGGTFVIKRATLKTPDRFRDVYSDDSAFLERYVASGRRVEKINSPTYIYHRDSPDSMCDNAGEKA